jgi:hypothetical protein
MATKISEAAIIAKGGVDVYIVEVIFFMNALDIVSTRWILNMWIPINVETWKFWPSIHRY